MDGHNYPNLPLMKLSAWHKAQGDSVEWYEPMFSGHMDRVYMSKVFSFSEDYLYCIDADEVVKGGSGYCINLENGREVFNQSQNHRLPPSIEHIYPDYGLYGITDHAYGFLTRGCPRGCEFCIVGRKEGLRSHKVADLSEFWRGQPNIDLLDPNILACKDWEDLLDQLARSKAWVDFNQGLDIRLMTEDKARALSRIKCREIHFAWDNYQDKDAILPKFKMFRKLSKMRDKELIVYVLTNFNTTFEQDLERVDTLRELGFKPYIMIYDKEHLPSGSPLRSLQRYVNNRWVFYSCNSYEEYRQGETDVHN